MNEWADILQWLKKVAKLLEDFKTPFIPQKLILSRRLAQCLNPQLPVGIHKMTLNIYKLIFENLKLDDTKKWASELAFYSMGIFPLFSYCSIQIKRDLLELIQAYYLPLEMELVPCLPALVTSMMPMIEENEEDVRKTANEIVEELKKVEN